MKYVFPFMFFILGMSLMLIAGTGHPVLYKISLVTLIVVSIISIAKYRSISKAVKELKKEETKQSRCSYRRNRIKGETNIARTYAKIAMMSLAISIAGVLFI